MNRLTITTWLLATALTACGQPKALRLPAAAKPKLEPEKVYTYVEQMPQLPGGGGMAAIVSEIQKRTHYPVINASTPTRYSGIKYTFVVDTTGKVRDAAIAASSDNIAVDQAIIDAVRSLPKLSPGRQAGQTVLVRFTLASSCILVR